MKSYRGSGGARPSFDATPKKSFGSFQKKGFRLYEDVQDGERKVVVPLGLDKGERDRPIVVLDEDLDFAVRMHKGFRHDGTWQNFVVCRSNVDAAGCPVCDVLKERDNRRFSWLLCATVIDFKPWSPTTGKNAGKVYGPFRRLVMIPSSEAEGFEAQGEDLEGGWRGACFKVSRSDKDKALRIGDRWIYDHRKGNMSDDELLSRVEESAERYGLSAEEFIRPFDYEKILAPPSYDDALEIAEAIKGSPLGKEEESPFKSGGMSDAAVPF